MNYLSTRRGVPPTHLSGAILAGLAADSGLYVPDRIPRLSVEHFAGAVTLPEFAHRMLSPFTEGDALAVDLQPLIAEAFTFDAPLTPLKPARTQSLELFHGPTAAFKDFGARFLAAAFRRLSLKGRKPVTVLVATSGDTGSAVGAAFHHMPDVRVVILYPHGLVSPRQAHQLGCFGDNVTALSVAGTFDDCQRLVKQAFGDAELKERRPLASANSISLGRLLPQMTYYARAAVLHWRMHQEPLNFAIPTGNLGNAFACLLARASGPPIGEVLLATNANRTVPDFLSSHVYAPRPSVATLANAMDVGAPSNLERLQWLHADPAQAGVTADSVADDAIKARIAAGEAQDGAVWCPHSACAAEAVARRRAAGDTRSWCIVATAHPSKFETVVEPLVGHAVPPPPALGAMLERPSHAEPLAAEYEALKARLLR